MGMSRIELTEWFERELRKVMMSVELGDMEVNYLQENYDRNLKGGSTCKRSDTPMNVDSMF